MKDWDERRVTYLAKDDLVAFVQDPIASDEEGRLNDEAFPYHLNQAESEDVMLGDGPANEGDDDELQGDAENDGDDDDDDGDHASAAVANSKPAKQVKIDKDDRLHKSVVGEVPEQSTADDGDDDENDDDDDDDDEDEDGHHHHHGHAAMHAGHEEDDEDEDDHESSPHPSSLPHDDEDEDDHDDEHDDDEDSTEGSEQSIKLHLARALIDSTFHYVTSATIRSRRHTQHRLPFSRKMTYFYYRNTRAPIYIPYLHMII